MRCTLKVIWSVTVGYDIIAKLNPGRKFGFEYVTFIQEYHEVGPFQ